MTTNTQDYSDSTRKFLESERNMLIGGEWLPAISGETLTVINPATGIEIARIPSGSSDDVDRAVKAARDTFEGSQWKQLTPSARGKLLWKIADLIEEYADELAEIETLDNGKPIIYAKAVDIQMAAETFRYFAGWCTKIEGKTLPLSTPGAEVHAYTRREPAGVVGLIVPWNYPLLLTSWKLAPALAAGCTCVLKPSEETSLSALKLGELFNKAGFPNGVVNIVTGIGETVGAALAEHPDVDKISFTGSTEVGRHIAKAATGNFKKITLELGGKSPNVILADADLPKAIEGSANAIFFNSGQTCFAGSRLYIERDVFEPVIEGLTEFANNLKIGNGLDQTTTMGPLISRKQKDRVNSMINLGVSEGAELISGGQQIGEQGFFVKPTILAHTRQDMSVVQDEIFGPVVVAMPVDDLSTITSLANDSIYGLAASIWTKDISRAHRYAAEIQAGTVWINCYGVVDPGLPFGGYKQSGWGRECGFDAIEEYTEVKSVVVML